MAAPASVVDVFAHLLLFATVCACALMVYTHRHHARVNPHAVPATRVDTLAHVVLGHGGGNHRSQNWADKDKRAASSSTWSTVAVASAATNTDAATDTDGTVSHAAHAYGRISLEAAEGRINRVCRTRNQAGISGNMSQAARASASQARVVTRGRPRQASSSHGSTPAKVAATDDQEGQINVQIWGKAAIADYLWEHVFGEDVTTANRGLQSDGVHTSGCVTLHFRKGWMVQTQTVPRTTTQHLVLVLNAHQPSKIATARPWLDMLPSMPVLKNVGLVILGQEDCNNTWLEPYLENPAYKIRFVFLVYNGRMMEDHVDRVFQWPLGVATYRGFPQPRSARPSTAATGSAADAKARVPMDTAAAAAAAAAAGAGPATARAAEGPPGLSLLCNFFGTVYENSSRADLVSRLQKMQQARQLRLVTDLQQRGGGASVDGGGPPGPGQSAMTASPTSACLVNFRFRWMPKETAETARAYLAALRNSAFTLAPAGQNTECYRWYEAASMGSTPVIEDVTKPRSCGRPATDLLKLHGAPFVFAGPDEWSSVAPLLDGLAHQAAPKRARVKAWYTTFLTEMRARFLVVMMDKFFAAAPVA